ncbi:unnamed protein product [Fraxinus pennsylvanica]|uniref:Uncharacterized protein n=1 Tax=Fraxinus pennsylvanica TaxID=56036 RepID=A0AAD2A6D3_9LAMI|nr:unnamed protein product [Fraxinus pennsylvanica]
MGRISSAVEIPEDRCRHSLPENGRYSTEPHNYHRLSPSISRSRSPSYSRSPPTRYDDRKKQFLDRDYRSGRHGESESDEELKSLGFEEYRRLKRQKLRKLLRNCIWNSTPSPPRDPEESSDLEPEDEITRKVEEEKENIEDNKLKSGYKRVSSNSSESESASGNLFLVQRYVEWGGSVFFKCRGNDGGSSSFSYGSRADDFYSHSSLSYDKEIADNVVERSP